MKRLVLIAAAVLVPFGALVLWGLSALRDEPLPVPPSSPPPQAEPAPPAQIADRAPVPAAAPQPAPLPAEPEAAPPPPEPSQPPLEPKAALVAELTPLVNLCFMEQNERLKQPIRVMASFEARPDGTLGNVRLKMKSGDPYLTACVQDALEGARVNLPQGMPQGSMRHTFTFNPQAPK